MRVISALLNCIILFSICTIGNSKELPKYPVSQIPESLKKGMYAVIRDSKTTIEIKSENSLTKSHVIAITILNSNAANFAQLAVVYDKFSVVKNFKGTIYDSFGSVVKRSKPSDIIDQSNSGGSLFSDNRFKMLDLTYAIYPFTVEFEYEIDEKKLYDIADFYLYEDDEVSIQKINFSLIFGVSNEPRIKLFKVQTPIESNLDNKKKLEWTFENFIPEKFEILSPDDRKIIPHILIAPKRFEYDGYPGNMESWKQYGEWQLSLNRNRDALPESTKQKVIELTESLTTVKSKTKVLYEYLQSKTRYVNISLGIGGLQPFPADIVDKTGYSDCKGLSNYMISLLAAAKIKGYYTKIMAGNQNTEIDTTFPSHQTNHIIVGVPNGIDTIWLECTSQNNPFNYLGRFTGDRNALMVTEDGGKIVHTHKYPAEVNTKYTLADINLTLEGNATAKVTTKYSGLQYENNYLYAVLDDQYDNQKKWVLNNTQIPTFDLVSFKMKNYKDEIPTAVVDLDLTLRKFASVSGKRLFLTPNLMNRSSFIPEKLEQRKSNVVLRTPYIDIDTIRYHVPEEIYPEFLPEPVVIKSAFGEYEARYIVDQGSIVYIRRMKRNKGEFPPDTYNDLINFYRAINKADNTKIVFLNKT